MGSHNNLTVSFQAVLFPSDSIRKIFSWLLTSVFSLVSKGSISDNVPIPLHQIWYRQILIPTYHGTLKPLYQDIYIYPYLNIYRSPYVHIYVSIYLDIIHTYLRIYGYIAHRLFIYRVGCICNRLLSLPIGLSTVLNYPLRNASSFHFPNTSPLSEQRRAGACGEQAPFMEHLCWRPPCDGRLSIALPLTLAGQKGPIFPKKIGASGGWAEPHLLAFTAP